MLKFKNVKNVFNEILNKKKQILYALIKEQTC